MHGLRRRTWCENLPMPLAHRDMPDEQLMQAYAAGDAAAFDALYARHEGALFRFVRRLFGYGEGGGPGPSPSTSR